MNKTKLMGAVITAATAMTGLCTEISQNVISDINTSSKAQSQSKTISKTESKGNTNEF